MIIRRVIKTAFKRPRIRQVYVCLCNALTDADIRRAADRDGAQRPAEVFEACRCRAQCGTCVRAVCALIGLRLKDEAALMNGAAAV